MAQIKTLPPLDGALPVSMDTDIDAEAAAAFFEALAPAELDAYAQAVTARRETADAMLRAQAQQVQRLRYRAALAERQFDQVDPDNRLVAAELDHAELGPIGPLPHEFGIDRDEGFGAQPLAQGGEAAEVVIRAGIGSAAGGRRLIQRV